VLLAQAVGSDGSALQAWTIKALEKKRDGDGESVLACFLCGRPRACMSARLLTESRRLCLARERTCHERQFHTANDGRTKVSLW